MLYHLLYPYGAQITLLNVTQYVTFRTAAASLTALAISLMFGPWTVSYTHLTLPTILLV